MIWNNLKSGQCPVENCQQILIQEKETIICPQCTFKIKMTKYLDLIKGTKSKAYKKKVTKYQFIQEYNKNKKERLIKAKLLQEKERQFNLKRMQKI